VFTQQQLRRCAESQAGEALNYKSMLNTQRAGVRLWPTAYVRLFTFFLKKIKNKSVQWENLEKK
jgi:hypothetical protein